jgi:DDE superfamily endonuclease
MTSARTNGILDALASAKFRCWADKGYQAPDLQPACPTEAGGRTFPEGQQAVNRSQANIRALVEPAVATLKTWRFLRKLRC